MRRPSILSGAARRVLSGDIDMGAFSEEEQSENEEMPEVPTTPRSAPPSAAAPQIGKRSQQDRTPTIKSPNDRPKSQLRVDGLADVASVADGADCDEGEPTGRLERREDDATGGVGSASDMSEEEEEDPNPFSLKKISEDLDEDWQEGEAFVAAPSEIGSGCAKGVFGVLHKHAAGSLDADAVRGFKPKYGAGIEGADVCDAEQLSRPYQPPKPPKLLPEGNAYRSGRFTARVHTSRMLDQFTLLRLRREMTWLVLERLPWFLRAPASEDLRAQPYGAWGLRPLTVRGTKYSMRATPDVYAMIEDAHDLVTQYDAASPTPRKKRGAATSPLSRLVRLGRLGVQAHELVGDQFAEAPDMLSVEEGKRILLAAHAPKMFAFDPADSERSAALLFYHTDPKTGLVRWCAVWKSTSESSRFDGVGCLKFDSTQAPRRGTPRSSRSRRRQGLPRHHELREAALPLRDQAAPRGEVPEQEQTEPAVPAAGRRRAARRRGAHHGLPLRRRAGRRPPGHAALFAANVSGPGGKKTVSAAAAGGVVGRHGLGAAAHQFRGSHKEGFPLAIAP